MLNDPEYREQVLQSRKIGRDKKRQAIEDDPLHVDARKDADRKAKLEGWPEKYKRLIMPWNDRR